MEFLFILVIVWAFVTVLGHGTWLILAALMQSLGSPTSASKPPPNPNGRPNPEDDFAAFSRMIDALTATERIDPATASRLRGDGQVIVAQASAGAAAASLPAAGLNPVRPSQSVPVANPATEESGSAVPVAAVPVQAVPHKPARPVADLIASFLADHNIRWGEIVAGLLIVVCSIGLVVSLWNTLAGTHRVVPTLIFMSADAAIFAAGLYTMRRWKLRHTSRAVLIIATLLVPLCVLAGLAAARADENSVRLDDPVTLLAIAIGTLGCGSLIFRSCVALVGRGTATALTIAVVTPSLALPLVPAAVRWLDGSAGWLTLLPAVIVAVAWLRRRRPGKPAIGRRAIKNNHLHLGLMFACMASLLVYASFAVRAHGPDGWIAIALGSIPFWMSLAISAFADSSAIRGPSASAASALHQRTSTIATGHFVTTVIGILGGLAVLVMLPAVVSHLNWLVLYGLIVAGCIPVMSVLIGRHWRSIYGGIPAGMVGAWSSKVWIAGESWQPIDPWRMIAGGEPMLVMAGLALGLAGLAAILRRTPGFQSAMRASAVFGVSATAASVWLTLAPPTWLGVVPFAFVSGVSFLGGGAFLWLSISRPFARWAQGVVWFVFACGCFQVVRWTAGDAMIHWPSVPSVLLLSTGLGGVAIILLDWLRGRSGFADATWMGTRDFQFDLAKWTLLATWATVALAAAQALGRVLLGPLFPEPWNNAVIAILDGFPVSPILCGVIVLGEVFRRRARCRDVLPFQQIQLLAAATIAVAVSAMIAHAASDDSITRLIVATSIASLCLLSVGEFGPEWLRRLPRWRAELDLNEISIGLTAGLLAAASFVLLIAGWFPLVADAQRPDALATGSVVAWWALASLGLAWWTRNRSMSPWRLLSATLAPGAVFIASPLVWPGDWLIAAQASTAGAALWLTGSLAVGSRSLDRGLWKTSSIDQGLRFNGLFVILIGFVSAGGAIAWSLTGAAGLDAAWSLPIGLITSVAAVGLVAWSARSPWWGTLPLAVTFSSGHIAALVAATGWMAPQHVVLVVAACLVVAGAWSATVHWRRGVGVHAVHVAALTVVVFGLSLVMPWNSSFVSQFWSVAAAGMLTIAGISLMRWSSPGSRIFGIAVLSGGAWTVLSIELAGTLASGFGWMERFTIVLAWLVGWVVVWRLRPHRRDDVPTGSRADLEAAWGLVLLAGLLGVGMLADFRWGGAATASLTPTAWAIGLLTMLGGAASLLRWRNPWSVRLGIATCVAASGLLVVPIAATAGADSNVVIVIAMLVMSTSLGAMAWTLSGIASLGDWATTTIAGDTRPYRGDDPVQWIMAHAIGVIAIILAVAGSCLAGSLFIAAESADLVRTAIGGVGLIVLVLSGLSEHRLVVAHSLGGGLRRAAVMTALWVLAMLAVLHFTPGQPFVLVATMRWLLMSVLAVGTLWIAVPGLLAATFVSRWRPSIRQGGWFAAVAAAGSLIVMLASEATCRNSVSGIPELSTAMVVVVAVVLAMLALMASAAVVVSGPVHSRGPHHSAKTGPDWLDFSDGQRRWLLWAAQAVAAATWLHLFLCRPDLAFLGLRQAWPYVVMGLAFVSVGVTEWARRRGDAFLAGEMRRTALFLPMIPVIGFWLSGSTGLMPAGWAYTGGVSYQSLLVVATIAYGFMSLLWKSGVPRVATVVLANVAFWVTLTQTPGWGFLSHPQAWLIPPAVCVLMVAWLQRNRLDPQVGSAIRYSATLVIYISSTADMLLTEIGMSLWGPVILVALSLLGMLLGVVMRIKPFLMLGSFFVLIGTVSMVWHAGVAIDAVWPWWVFGITTGLLLLTGLAMLERHKPHLTRWANQVALWS